MVITPTPRRVVRDEIISLRATPGERRRWEIAAAGHEVTLSEWMRHVLALAAQASSPERP
ncbi:MAG: hypothetical protein ACRETX_17225 [Steroidobacteraceae bacterium]